jgi:hypothetical protein
MTGTSPEGLGANPFGEIERATATRERSARLVRTALEGFAAAAGGGSRRPAGTAGAGVRSPRSGEDGGRRPVAPLAP